MLHKLFIFMFVLLFGPLSFDFAAEMHDVEQLLSLFLLLSLVQEHFQHGVIQRLPSFISLRSKISSITVSPSLQRFWNHIAVSLALENNRPICRESSCWWLWSMWRGAGSFFIWIWFIYFLICEILDYWLRENECLSSLHLMHGVFVFAKINSLHHGFYLTWLFQVSIVLDVLAHVDIICGVLGYQILDLRILQLWRLLFKRYVEFSIYLLWAYCSRVKLIRPLSFIDRVRAESFLPCTSQVSVIIAPWLLTNLQERLLDVVETASLEKLVRFQVLRLLPQLINTQLCPLETNVCRIILVIIGR